MLFLHPFLAQMILLVLIHRYLYLKLLPIPLPRPQPILVVNLFSLLNILVGLNRSLSSILILVGVIPHLLMLLNLFGLLTISKVYPSSRKIWQTICVVVLNYFLLFRFYLFIICLLLYPNVLHLWRLLLKSWISLIEKSHPINCIPQFTTIKNKLSKINTPFKTSCYPNLKSCIANWIRHH